MTRPQCLPPRREEPAQLFGFDGLGGIVPGKRASLIVTREDPLADLGALGSPSAVLLDGVWRGPGG